MLAPYLAGFITVIKLQKKKKNQKFAFNDWPNGAQETGVVYLNLAF